MIAAAALILVVVLYRILLGIMGSHDMTWLHNFSPLAAVALCGGVYLPRKVALFLPMAMLLASDIVLNIYYQKPFFTMEILPHYLCIALITALGFLLRGRVRLPGLLFASAGGSLIFYVITNTGSWIAEPGYQKTFAGWMQALTVGLPGYPSTWHFYQNTFASDIVFTLLFVACMRFARPDGEVHLLAPRHREPAAW